MPAARASKVIAISLPAEMVSKARSKNAQRYTEDDVERLVKQTSQELEPARKVKRRAARRK